MRTLRKKRSLELTIDGGIISRSTARTVLTKDSKARKLHKVRDIINSEEHMCSLCSTWGSDWVELYILEDDEIYCLSCTGKGLHEIYK